MPYPGPGPEVPAESAAHIEGSTSSWVPRSTATPGNRLRHARPWGRESSSKAPRQTPPQRVTSGWWLLRALLRSARPSAEFLKGWSPPDTSQFLHPLEVKVTSSRWVLW